MTGIAPGTRLGPYQLETLIGAGGMGEVYRATDTRLGRAVAVKVLSPEVGPDADLRERFEREARAISSLSHPNICALFDVGRVDGVEYLVMELLDGETLADRLSRGALPTRQALRVGAELARALDRAHRQGIVHRDVKPGNVMLTRSGVKLLDFGLAKARPASMRSRIHTEPFARPITQKGSIVGTIQYMAPEQIEGAEADVRTDIFALGAILFEMATGRRAFEGKSQASLLAAILGSEPPPASTLSPMTPRALDRVVRTCLAKDPDERWQTMHDVALQLSGLEESLSSPGEEAAQAAPRPRRRLLRAAVVAVAAVSLGALGAVTAGLRSMAPARDVRFLVTPPAGGTFPYGAELSPDGRQLAFVAYDGDGKQGLYVRSLDDVEARLVSGTEGASDPFWSPDGRSIAFSASGRLRRVEPDGAGSPQTICEPSSRLGASWGRDGTILFVPSYGGPIYRVPAAGGTPVAVTSLDATRHEVAHLTPRFLPDGKRFLYLARSRENGDARIGSIRVGSLDGSPSRRLRAGDGVVGVSSSGYLVFYNEGSLQAQRLDGRTLMLLGDPQPIPGRVLYTGTNARAWASLSSSGALAFRSDPPTMRRLVLTGREGKELGTLGPPAEYHDRIRFSPDGRRLAVARLVPRTGLSELRVVDVERDVSSPFSSGAAEELWPVWSTGGRSLIFGSDVNGIFDILERTLEGGAPDSTRIASGNDKVPMDATADGALLYLNSAPGERGLVLAPAGGGRPQALGRGRAGRLSPDGRLVAMVENESGRDEVYVQRVPSGTARLRISPDGGSSPVWRADGRELFYVSGDSMLMSVRWSPPSDGTDVARPLPLFRVSQTQLEQPWSYDVAPDGRSFVLLEPISRPGPASQITVSLHWRASLR